MATVSTTATFAPTFEKFDVPMRPDNTPIWPMSPIARLVWDGSVVVPALTGSDVSELAVVCEVPTNYAIRMTSVDWTLQITGGNSIGDMNDVTDLALLTFSSATRNRSVPLRKPAAAQLFTVTNAFSELNFTPFAGIAWNRVYRDDFSTSGIIFRNTNSSTNDTAAATYICNMEAMVYTVEQLNQAYIYTGFESLASGGASTL